MNTYVLTLACLCAGLLFDPYGFLRMSLAASAIHEFGHIAAYLFIRQKFPQLSFSAGGIALKYSGIISRGQEFILAAAGPFFNFAAAGVFYAFYLYKASYLLGFFIAVNLCIGVYNLIPAGVLDGAKLLELALPSRKAYFLYTINKALNIALSAALLLFAIFLKASILIKFGLITACVYLLVCEFKS